MHNLCVFGLKKLFLSVSIYVLVWPSVVSLMSDSLAGVSNQQPAGHRQPRMARNAARHKIVNLLKTLRFFFWLPVSMYLMCGPRQLFFFQCGPETPKSWTTLLEACVTLPRRQVLSTFNPCCRLQFRSIRASSPKFYDERFFCLTNRFITILLKLTDII